MGLIESSIFGVRVCAGTRAEAVKTVHEHALHSPGVVCVANVDMVTRAVSDSKLAGVMQRAIAVVTDGMPLVWVLRARGLDGSRRVYGPQFTRDLCALCAETGTPVYFFGGSPIEVERMRQHLLSDYPGLRIVGTESPPLLPTEPPLCQEVVDRINASGARLVFVGLGCPKQEYWMATHAPHVDATMVGVGMAFRQISGLLRQAPRWMQVSGLEWLFRLLQEPQRLWRRYLLGNSRFVWYLALEVFGRRIR